MLACSARPFDSPEHLYEVKWDGIRCIAYTDPDHTHLQSRNLRWITRRYPELASLHRSLDGRHLVLDGEIVLYEGHGSDFSALLRREQMRSQASILRASREHPVLYVAFDLLFEEGRDLRPAPVERRKDRLLELGLPAEGEHLAISRHVVGGGVRYFEQVRDRGLEGVVAKALGSPYLCGRRSQAWLKIKAFRSGVARIGGFVPAKGSLDLAGLADPSGLVGAATWGGAAAGPAGAVASLALGLPAEPSKEVPLVYIGHVGTGLGPANSPRGGQAPLLQRLLPLRQESCPFVNVPQKGSRRTIWVRPALACRVEYLEFTPEGHLRHPIFRGLVDG